MHKESELFSVVDKMSPTTRNGVLYAQSICVKVDYCSNTSFIWSL